MSIKIDERVVATLPCDGKGSIQYEEGKVIYIGRRILVEFDHNICGHSGHGLGKPRYCWMMDWDKLKEVDCG